MLLLAGTNHKLQVVTSAAVALDVHASWVDNNAGTITPGVTNSLISTATTTDIVGAPAASTARNIREVTLRARGGANTVIVKHTDGTSVPEMIKVALLQDELLEFTDGNGWKVFDVTGAIKMSFAPTAGRYLKTTVYGSGSGNHTTDPKCSHIKVRMVGGGGGGGGCTSVASSAACGGGGGAGSYAEKDWDVSPSTAYAYSVGAAGTAGANTGGTGGAGGNSTFTGPGAVVVTAPGGSGGVGQTGATTQGFVAGGNGGAVATNGDTNGGGDPGDYAYRISGTVGVSGRGGSTRSGGGGAARTTQGAGNAGVGEGSGGGGGLCLNGGGAVTGGAGQTGIILVEEYT